MKPLNWGLIFFAFTMIVLALIFATLASNSWGQDSCDVISNEVWTKDFSDWGPCARHLYQMSYLQCLLMRVNHENDSLQAVIDSLDTESKSCWYQLEECWEKNYPEDNLQAQIDSLKADIKMVMEIHGFYKCELDSNSSDWYFLPDLKAIIQQTINQEEK